MSRLDSPSAGTAGGNEMEAFHRNAQRDDAEATDPEAVQQRMAAGSGQTPDGFYWSKDTSGKPILKPTQSAINQLAAAAKEVYEDFEEREAQLKVDKPMLKGLNDAVAKIRKKQQAKPVLDLAKAIGEDNADLNIAKALERTLKRLDSVNQYLALDLVRAVSRQFAQSFCSNLYWAEIHREACYNRQENNNENGAEQSLINFESSRTQLLVAAQLLDWAKEAGVEPDLDRGARDALGLRGWSETNRQAGSNRAAVRQNTKEAIFGKVAETPEDLASTLEDDDPEDIPI